MSCTVLGIRPEASSISIRSSVWRSLATLCSPARSAAPISPEATTSN